MKIEIKDYEVLKDSIGRIPKDTIASQMDFVRNENRFKCFETRIAWDLFWLSVCFRPGDFLNNLYRKGLNDGNLETAIKKALKELNILSKT